MLAISARLPPFPPNCNQTQVQSHIMYTFKSFSHVQIHHQLGYIITDSREVAKIKLTKDFMPLLPSLLPLPKVKTRCVNAVKDRH